MPLSDAAAGTLGEYLFAAACLRTSDGELEVFRPVADDDHRDFEVHRRRHFAPLWVQVKTATRLVGRRVVASTHYTAGQAPDSDPRLLYAVLYVPWLTIEMAWLVPSPDFAARAYTEPNPKTGALSLTLEASTASADIWSPYLVAPDDLGPALLARLPDDAPRRVALL